MENREEESLKSKQDGLAVNGRAKCCYTPPHGLLYLLTAAPATAENAVLTPPTSLFHLESVALKSHLLKAAKCHLSKLLYSEANWLVCFIVGSVWASTLETEERGFGNC